MRVALAAARSGADAGPRSHRYGRSGFALAGLAALAGCSAGAATTPVDTRVTADTPAWQVRGMGGVDPIEVGTTDPALLDANGCATCHPAIVDEWSTSRHALAWTNGIFQREYQAKPQSWCVNCHAPTPAQQAELAAAGDGGAHPLADQGINCATCHVRGGRMVAAKRAASSPHDTTVEASFGTPAFCADCHQFTFPVLAHKGGAALRMTEHPMQDTVASFLRGPYATEPDGCMTCHGSRTNHAFAGGHDAGMLGAAITVDWCRRDGEIIVTLTNAAAGHNVPTGDIHRHMNLRVWRSSAPESLYEGFLGRRFAPADDGGKVTTWDSSIPPGGTQRHTISIAELGADDPESGEPPEPINLELNYVFIADEFPHRDRIPAEPGSTTIVQWRTDAGAIAACAAD